jgi:hypothetical protein
MRDELGSEMLLMNHHAISLFVREVEAQCLECTYLDIGDGANNGQLNVNALNFYDSVSVTGLLNRKFDRCLSL